MKRIGIIIPTFNRKDCLHTLLTMIQQQQHDGFTFFTIIANDGSSDGTSEMLATDFPDVIEVKGSGNWWYTQSINEGLQEFMKHDADYALTLNDDIELKNDYLQHIFDASQQFDQPILMGSVSVTSDAPNRITFSGIKKIVWWRSKHQYYHTPFQEVNWKALTGIHPSVVLPGRGILIDRRILEIIGPFEKKLIQYGSDDEFCLRAAKKGFGVYVCWDAVIYSHYKMTSAVTNYLKPTFKQVMKGYFNHYSRNYWFKDAFIHFHYGNKLAFPLTMGILLLGNLKSVFSQAK